MNFRHRQTDTDIVCIIHTMSVSVCIYISR